MRWQFDDGGRETAGYRGHSAGDCVTRAIAIATGKPYQEVYDALNALCRADAKVKKRGGSSRTGVPRRLYEKYLKELGWHWTPTMMVGQGCKVHLREGELPGGRLIVAVSKHLTAVIDGIIHDTYDPQRAGTRCVYGYYQEGTRTGLD